MTIFVAVDIGCLECGEESCVLGLFRTHTDAQNACDAAEQTLVIKSHVFHVFECQFQVGPSDVTDDGGTQ